MTVRCFQVLGRMKPSPKNPEPKVYRMKLFATNEVTAKSKFWYFIRCAAPRRAVAARRPAKLTWPRTPSCRRAASCGG